MLDNPKATWKDAQAKLDKSTQTIITQMAKMKDADKAKWSEFHKTDWKGANKAWQRLAKNNPGQKEVIEKNKLLAQLKMVFGKHALKSDQREDINKFLEELVEDGEDYGIYWGY